MGASIRSKPRTAAGVERHLGRVYRDMDDIFWRPGWQKTPLATFRAEVAELTSRPAWVLAGNYSSVRDLTWPRADTRVWLDLPLPRTLWRSALRVLRQARSGEPICNGNRQTVAALFFGNDPLLWYAIKTVPARRRQWPHLLAQSEHAHINVARLKSAAAVARWQQEATRSTPVPYVA